MTAAQILVLGGGSHVIHDNLPGTASTDPLQVEENNYANFPLSLPAAPAYPKPAIPSLKKKPAPLPPLQTPPTPPKKAPLKLPIED